MSNLKITTRTKNALINPSFVSTVIAIVDGKNLPPVEVFHVDAIINTDSAEASAENDIIQYMCNFMLNAGYKIGVHIEDGRYVFANKDDDFMATFGDEWQLEYKYTEVKLTEESIACYGPIEDFLEQNFKRLYTTCKNANAISPIPFSDIDYYAEMLKIHMSMDKKDAAIVAIRLHMFDKFKATGKLVDNLELYSEMEHDRNVPGMVYLDNLVINKMDDKGWHGEWYLVIENCQYQSFDLEELELILFSWCMPEREDQISKL